MKPAERVALIYGASFATAAAVSWFRGRRDQDLLVDTALHGVVGGTALNVIGWMVLDSGMIAARKNGSEIKGMGKLPKDALDLLAQVDADHIYNDLKENGVKVAAIPTNPSIVMQDRD